LIKIIDDVECCMACMLQLKEGDKVYHEMSGGLIHAHCCGPERESYYGADEQPLGEDDPIPEPWEWKPLSVDHRPDWKQDQAETSRLPQLGVTPDNFDQLLSDVLADMNADDEAAAAATTQKDDSF
jgi:hypothetical protein